MKRTIIALALLACAQAHALSDPQRGPINLTEDQGTCPKGRKVAIAGNGDRGCWRAIKKGTSIKWKKGEKPQHYEVKPTT